MRKTNRWLGRRWTISWLAVAVIYLEFSAVGSAGQERAATTNDASNAKTTAGKSLIPVGTVLPVILRTTIAPDKIKQGQAIHGEIAQEVPLPGGTKISKGSKVEGHIVEVAPSGNGSGAKVSLRFDKVYSRGQAITVVTDLRALAGFMEVQGAGLPDLAAGEGEVVRWSTTTQVGGDSVYGADGPVSSAEDSTQIVGKSVDGGVLVQVRAKEGTPCRGPINGNDAPQAMWVFSSDACGVYGVPNVKIAHAGRTEPVGTIVFEMQGHNTKIRSADGMLLRVTG